MGRHERLLQTVLRGRSDANIRFADLRALLFHLGFSERIRGGHHLFDKSGIMEIMNLQSQRVPLASPGRMVTPGATEQFREKYVGKAGLR